MIDVTAFLLPPTQDAPQTTAFGHSCPPSTPITSTPPARTRHTRLPPKMSTPENTADVLDEIERLEQGITRTLQEIDQSFSNCHLIVSSKILPQIDRYSESSREVYEQAKRWLGFFEAASAPAAPTTGRRTRAFRDARDRQQAFMDTAHPEPEPASVAPRRTSRLSNLYDSFEESSTNRPRINSINLSSPRLSTGFLGSSPMRSIPSTPTPLRGNHRASQQQLTRDNLPTPDRMRTKAGTVIPRPIFDSDNEDVAAAAENNSGERAEEADIGGSKKRSRDGDFLDMLESAADGGSTSWTSLTDHQREKERLLKSPRKMASVQDIFAPSSVNTNGITSAHQEEEISEDRGQSPSRELMSQIGSQADYAVDEEEQEDPLLAALATPPEARKVIMEHKARASLMPQRPLLPLFISSTSAASPSKASAPFTSSSASIWSSSEISARIAATPTTSFANHESLLTTTPIGTTGIGTTGIDSTPISSARSAIDSIFKKSFDTGFATSSSRRQTMATPVDSSRNQHGASIFSKSSSSQGYGGRNSIGPGIKTSMTPTPFDSPRRAGLGRSRLSLLSRSLLRRPVYPTSASPASRAAASAIASAAMRTDRRTSQSGQSSSSINIFSSSAGSHRADARVLSTPVVSTASMLVQGHDVPLTTLAAGSASQTALLDSDFSSRGFLMPFTPFTDRNPPPAPRLGYHSDTIMTQSSLGLNHDGFGGFDSEDQTRNTMGSNISAREISSVETIGMLSRPPNASAGTMNGRQAIGRRRIAEEEFGDDEGEGDEEDEDVTGSIMRSPCPPDRNFFGSNTDLKSVAQAAASARPGGSLGGGSNLFRRQ